MPVKTLWAAILAIVATLAPCFVQAHPLPGSALTLSRQPAGLDLTITLPVDELILAQPSLAGLQLMPKAEPLPSDTQDDLTAYLADHLSLTPANQPPLNLQLVSADLQTATHADVAAYDLLIVVLAAPLPASQNLYPLTLTYDGIMHEVRNHRATVFVKAVNGNPMAVGEIRRDAVGGIAAPFILTAAP